MTHVPTDDRMAREGSLGRSGGYGSGGFQPVGQTRTRTADRVTGLTGTLKPEHIDKMINQDWAFGISDIALSALNGALSWDAMRLSHDIAEKKIELEEYTIDAQERMHMYEVDAMVGMDEGRRYNERRLAETEADVVKNRDKLAAETQVKITKVQASYGFSNNYFYGRPAGPNFG